MVAAHSRTISLPKANMDVPQIGHLPVSNAALVKPSCVQSRHSHCSFTVFLPNLPALHTKAWYRAVSDNVVILSLYAHIVYNGPKIIAAI